MFSSSFLPPFFGGADKIPLFTTKSSGFLHCIFCHTKKVLYSSDRPIIWGNCTSNIGFEAWGNISKSEMQAVGKIQNQSLKKILQLPVHLQ